jgi:glycosyltransferase involved in cell wall biosynthesis
MISIIIPVFNEEANLAWHHGKITEYLATLPYQFELLYVNDGSRDKSLAVLKSIAAQDSHTRYVSFSRNFGKEAATTAGLRACRGDAAIIIDADGQHPIEVIQEFIERWQAGGQVIIGVRRGNAKAGFIKRFGSRLFYKTLDTLGGGKPVAGATDFRLLDRRVIDEFNRLSERNRMTRGLIDWLGFRREYVPFLALKRHGGKASYSVRKLFRLAMHGLVAQSTRPLQLTGVLGIAVMVISALLSVSLVVEKYALGDVLHLAITGSAILALFVSFLVGIVLVCQWLLALYIESIYVEAQNRPLYVVDEDSMIKDVRLLQPIERVPSE